MNLLGYPFPLDSGRATYSCQPLDASASIAPVVPRREHVHSLVSGDLARPNPPRKEADAGACFGASSVAAASRVFGVIRIAGNVSAIADDAGYSRGQG